MRLIGRNRLEVLYGLDSQTDAWVSNWLSEISHAHWKVAKDVLRQYPKVKVMDNDLFLFPVGDQPKHIEVAITFRQSVVLVVSLKQMN